MCIAQYVTLHKVCTLTKKKFVVLCQILVTINLGAKLLRSPKHRLFALGGGDDSVSETAFLWKRGR